MRNAAMFLGIIGGLVGMVVGFFGYAFVWLTEEFPEAVGAAQEAGILGVIDNPMLIKVLAMLSPILAITGGAMAPSRPAIAAILLVLSAVGMYAGFDFDIFTMFPIGMCGLAGLLAVLGALLPPVEAHH
ncbi:MAG: hypothetical protein AAGH68_13830 [Pseudomonadota bacterium]